MMRGGEFVSVFYASVHWGTGYVEALAARGGYVHLGRWCGSGIGCIVSREAPCGVYSLQRDGETYWVVAEVLFKVLFFNWPECRTMGVDIKAY